MRRRPRVVDAGPRTRTRAAPSARRSASASGTVATQSAVAPAASAARAHVRGAVPVAVRLHDRPELGALEHAQQRRARCAGSRRGRSSAANAPATAHRTDGSCARARRRSPRPSDSPFAATQERKLARAERRPVGDEQARPAGPRAPPRSAGRRAAPVRRRAPGRARPAAAQCTIRVRLPTAAATSRTSSSYVIVSGPAASRTTSSAGRAGIDADRRGVLHRDRLHAVAPVARDREDRACAGDPTRCC